MRQAISNAVKLSSLSRSPAAIELHHQMSRHHVIRDTDAPPNRLESLCPQSWTVATGQVIKVSIFLRLLSTIIHAMSCGSRRAISSLSSPIKRKESGFVPFRTKQTKAAKTHKALGREMRGKWVGFMPPHLFIEKYTNAPPEPCPRVSDDLFHGVPFGTEIKEQDMYPPMVSNNAAHF